MAQYNALDGLLFLLVLMLPYYAAWKAMTSCPPESE